MKRILILFSSLLLILSAKGQFPNNTNQNNAQTLLNYLGGVKSNIVLNSYTDTTAANTALYISGVVALHIFCTSDNSVYVRNSTHTAWLKQASGTLSTFYNSNIGSGYRIAVPNTNNLKTLFPGYGMFIDSSSNSNALTIKVDTTTLGGVRWAQNGLYKSGTVVKMGGPWTENTVVGNAGHDFTLVADNITHGGGTISSVAGTSNQMVVGGSGSGLVMNASHVNLAFGSGGSQIDFASDVTLGSFANLNVSAGVSGYLKWTSNAIERLRILSNGAWSLGSSGTATGTAGQYFGSNGSSAVPTWQDIKLSPVGDFLTSTFPGSSFPATFTNVGATVSVSSGMTISGGDGGYFSAYVRGNYPTASANWRDSINFTLNTASTDVNGGIFIGRTSSNAAINASIFATAKRVSSTTWRVVLKLMSSGTTTQTVDSTETITMTTGNNYRITLSSSNNYIFAKFQHIVAGAETEVATLQYKYIPFPSISVLVANTGYPCIGVLGSSGNFKVTNFNEYHYDLKNCDIAFVGTSITCRYYARSVSEHYTTLAFQNSSKAYAVFGGPGDRIQEMRDRCEEIHSLNPTYCVIEGGVNDTYTAIRSYLTSLIDTIKGFGIIPIVLQVFTDPSKDTILTNVCREENVLLINPGVLMTSTMFENGSVHPNGQGFAFIANSIKLNAPFLMNRTGGTETGSLRGLVDTYINGATIAQGDYVAYDTTTSKWLNTPISGLGTAFIKNQGASAQTPANFWISGSGVINTSLGVGISPATPFHVYENSVNGNGSRFENAGSSATVKYTSLIQLGSTGFGVTDWPNAALLESGDNLVLSGYGGSIKFQTGSSRTTRGGWTSTGLGIGTISPSTPLHVVGTPRFVTGNEGAGKFLISDANGVGDWNSGNGYAWQLGGNSETNITSNFIGTTDNIGLKFKANGNQAAYIDLVHGSTSFGNQAMASSTGAANAGFGQGTLFASTGDNNTAMGDQALTGATTGTGNSGLGSLSLSAMTTGKRNIGLGYYAGAYLVADSQRLFINSLDRTNYVGDTTKSIIYGIQNATATSQRLKINAGLQVVDGTQGASKVFTSDANGLGSWQTASGGGLTVGTTTIASGTSTRVLYNNAGVIGEYPITGTGNVMLSASPTTTGTLTGAASTWSGLGTFNGLVNISGGTLSGSSQASNFLNVTGTMPATMSTTTWGNYINITGAGSSAQASAALRLVYQAGYTGAGRAIGLSFVNASQSTATDMFYNSSDQIPGGNCGFSGVADNTTTGTNIGGHAEALGGNINIGIFAKSAGAKNGATNIGVLAQGINTGTTPIQIAGYFGLNSVLPTFSSGALQADNGSTTSDIFVARDNGTAVLTIADGGGITATGTANITGITTFGAQATLKGYTVATLPAGTVGQIVYCTDLLTPAFLVVVVGGGAVVGPVFYNGANWVSF